MIRKLAQEGVFTILNRADDKLISRRTTPEKIGVSKRRYYSRLRTLQNYGLIVKEGEGYVLTDAGKCILENMKQMAFILLLSRSEKTNKRV